MKKVNEIERDRRILAGAWFREKRLDRGLTQRELSDRIGYRYYAHISQVETGRIRMPSDDINAWARALNTHSETLTMKYLELYEPTLYNVLHKRSAAA